MTVMWFSFSDRAGVADSHRAGIRGRQRFISEPQPQPGLSYTDLERAEEIPGLDQGSWLLRDGNVKHVVKLTGCARAADTAMRSGRAEPATPPTRDGTRASRTGTRSGSWRCRITRPNRGGE